MPHLFINSQLDIIVMKSKEMKVITYTADILYSGYLI